MPEITLDDLDGDEPQDKTPTELYAELLAFNELIITVSAADVAPLKQGLASAKYKAKERARTMGFPLEQTSMNFSETPSTIHPGAVDVKVTLGRRGTIQVLQMTLPDSEL